MNKTQSIGAMRGVLDAMMEAQPNLTEERRVEFLDALLLFRKTDDPNPIIHIMISLLGGNSEQLMNIPEQNRKERIYMHLADDLEREAVQLGAQGHHRAAEYLTTNAQYYREMPPVITGQALTEEAASIYNGWQEKQKSFRSAELAQVRESFFRIARNAKDINVKTTSLLQWIFMARDIDWEELDKQYSAQANKVMSRDPHSEMFDRILGTVLRRVGLGIIDSHETITRLLDENLEGGAKSVDSDTFMQLCSMKGPEVYAAVVQLVKAEKGLRSISGRNSEDPKLKSIRNQAMHRMAAQDTAMNEAAKYVQNRADFQKKLEGAGLDKDEILTRTEEYDRYVFEAIRNPNRE